MKRCSRREAKDRGPTLINVLPITAGGKGRCFGTISPVMEAAKLKVHKREKFFVSDFEFFTIL
jgi:hypothetical protein